MNTAPQTNMEPRTTTEGNRTHISQKFWLFGILADVAAVISVLVGPGKNLVAVIGSVALLVGTIQFITRYGKPVDRWTILAVVGIVAGATSIAIVLDRAVTDDRSQVNSSPTGTKPIFSTEPSEQNSDTGTSATYTTPTSNSTPSPGDSTAPKASTPADSNKGLSITNTDPIDSEYHGFKPGALKVNGERYADVKSVNLDCIYVNETHQLDREYGTFKSKIGLGDATASGYSVKFSVYADGEPVASEVVSLGEVKEVTADITNAFRITLEVDIVEDRCASRDTVTAAWIGPTVTK